MPYTNVNALANLGVVKAIDITTSRLRLPPFFSKMAKVQSEINVIISDDTCSYEGSMVLQAGEIKVNVDATGEDKKTYGLTFFSLDPGKDLVDLMATTPLPSPPSWSNMLTLWEVGSGVIKTYTFTAEEGPLYLVCWSKPPDLAVGNVGPFEVK